MKKPCHMITLILCACLSLTGFAQAAGSARFTAADLKTLWIDGSTATIPLDRAIYKHFLRLNEAELDTAVTHSGTSRAYENLFADPDTPWTKVDLILVTEPYDDDLTSPYYDAPVPVDVIPIVNEALVFINNIDNPVTGLSQDELRGIYTGKLTNWNQVGGNDAAIIPYQRNQYSGSQTLFIQHLMKDVPPMTPPEEVEISSMGYLIDQVTNYHNEGSALGYTVYYYLNSMYGNDRLRMLAIDGIAPSPETITSGEYPLCTHYYAIIRKDAAADAPVRRLLVWLLSDEGQQVMKNVGYLPLSQEEREEALKQVGSAEGDAK